MNATVLVKCMGGVIIVADVAKQTLMLNRSVTQSHATLRACSVHALRHGAPANEKNCAPTERRGVR
jgi:hypothetical protein